MGHLVRWVRAIGFEGHGDQLAHLLRTAPKPTSVGLGAPSLAWKLSERKADVTLIRAGAITRWDARARRVRLSTDAEPVAVPKSVFERPYALIGPTPSDVAVGLCVNSNDVTQVQRMWMAFGSELYSALVRFTVGRQLIELLASHNESGDGIYHLSDRQSLLATAQPSIQTASIAPSAHSEQVWGASWQRRPSAAVPPPQFATEPFVSLITHYCANTTSRLFKPRLRAARFSLSSVQAVAIDGLDEQTLAILVSLQPKPLGFDDLVCDTGMDDSRLGNLLVGLHLSGMLHIESESKFNSLVSTERTPSAVGPPLLALGEKPYARGD